MKKSELIKILQGLLKTDNDLDFLKELERKDMETLVRERVQDK